MTGGIPDYANQPAFWAAETASLDTVFTPTQLVSFVADMPLGPTTFAYSNTNYAFVGMIIERAGLDTYAHQLTRRVVAPLGLRDTCYAPSGCAPGTARRMATGYFDDPSEPPLVGKAVPPLNLTVAYGAGAIVSSLADQTADARTVWVFEGKSLGFRVVHIFDPKTGVDVVVAANNSVGAQGDGLPGLALQALTTVEDGNAPRHPGA